MNYKSALNNNPRGESHSEERLVPSGCPCLHYVDRNGEHDGGVLLRGDRVQRLQVTQLKRSRTLSSIHVKQFAYIQLEYHRFRLSQFPNEPNAT